jgi:MraZ protein
VTESASKTRRLHGNERLALDSKGRVSVPSVFREQLADMFTAREASRFVLVPGTDPCIRVYPAPFWAALVAGIDAQLDQLDNFDADEEIAEVRRLIYGSAIDITLDANGRFVLPRSFRDELDLKDEVHWVSAGRYLEIWNPTVYDERARADVRQKAWKRLATMSRDVASRLGVAGGGGES